MDYDSLSLKELKEIQVQVNKAIATFEDRRKRDAVQKLEANARDLGFSLSELLDASQSKKRGAAPAKYVNPHNADETWSGRGRKPRWYLDAVAAGKKPEELEI